MIEQTGISDEATNIIRHLVDLLEDSTAQYEPNRCMICQQAYHYAKPHSAGTQEIAEE